MHFTFINCKFHTQSIFRHIIGCGHITGEFALYAKTLLLKQFVLLCTDDNTIHIASVHNKTVFNSSVSAFKVNSPVMVVATTIC
jgi:hypothetical protein